MLHLKSSTSPQQCFTDTYVVHKILIFTTDTNEIRNWLPWLEPEFAVSIVTHYESFNSLALTWNPDVIIYASRKIDSELTQSIVKLKAKIKFGMVFVGHSYSLREELSAFKLGADHFLLLSSPSESIKARLQSLARKTDELKHIAIPANTTLLPQKAIQPFDNLRLLPAQMSVEINGNYTLLSPLQFKILVCLVENYGELVSRETIQKTVFKDKKMSLRTIDAHIAKLKLKLPAIRGLIVNIYGQGYVFRNNKIKAA